MAKNYFDPVDLQVNFPELEKEILAKWDKKKVVKKYLNRNSHAKKYFSFLDGPITFRNKKDIEAFGVDKFVQLCKDRVKKYSNIQTEQSKRLGYFMDWENSYYTLSDDNNYMIWHFLKVCNDYGWIYKGQDSVAWCPRCETAISQHEILTEDYKEL
ncbi:MAG: Isoleucyl-tRNA synthetase, partial [Microgenomates group bacterium GW2011_GWC1_41_20]